MFRLGLIINPVAGIGGAVGLKGSDGVVAEALARGAVPKAQERARQALLPLCDLATPFELLTVAGEMGPISRRLFSCLVASSISPSLVLPRQPTLAPPPT